MTERVERAAEVLYTTERETRWCDHGHATRTGRMRPPARPWRDVDAATRMYYLARAADALTRVE
jgi:hypothetical protein